MKGDDCIQRIWWGMVVHDCNTVSVGGQESQELKVSLGFTAKPCLNNKDKTKVK